MVRLFCDLRKGHNYCHQESQRKGKEWGRRLQRRIRKGEDLQQKCLPRYKIKFRVKHSVIYDTKLETVVKMNFTVVSKHTVALKNHHYEAKLMH